MEDQSATSRIYLSKAVQPLASDVQLLYGMEAWRAQGSVVGASGFRRMVATRDP